MGIFEWIERRRIERERQEVESAEKIQRQLAIQLQLESEESVKKERERKQREIEQRTARENRESKKILEAILANNNLFNKSDFLEEKMALQGRIVGGLLFLVEKYPHREDWYDTLQSFKKESVKN